MTREVVKGVSGQARSVTAKWAEAMQLNPIKTGKQVNVVSSAAAHMELQRILCGKTAKPKFTLHCKGKR